MIVTQSRKHAFGWETPVKGNPERGSPTPPLTSTPKLLCLFPSSVREEWGGLLWKEGEDRKQRKENLELICFTSGNSSNYSELGNNLKAGYIPVWVKLCWYVIFFLWDFRKREEGVDYSGCSWFRLTSLLLLLTPLSMNGLSLLLSSEGQRFTDKERKGPRRIYHITRVEIMARWDTYYMYG